MYVICTSLSSIIVKRDSYSSKDFFQCACLDKILNSQETGRRLYKIICRTNIFIKFMLHPVCSYSYAWVVSHTATLDSIFIKMSFSDYI